MSRNVHAHACVPARLPALLLVSKVAYVCNTALRHDVCAYMSWLKHGRDRVAMMDNPAHPTGQEANKKDKEDKKKNKKEKKKEKKEKKKKEKKEKKEKEARESKGVDPWVSALAAEICPAKAVEPAAESAEAHGASSSAAAPEPPDPAELSPASLRKLKRARQAEPSASSNSPTPAASAAPVTSTPPALAAPVQSPLAPTAALPAASAAPAAASPEPSAPSAPSPAMAASAAFAGSVGPVSAGSPRPVRSSLPGKGAGNGDGPGKGSGQGASNGAGKGPGPGHAPGQGAGPAGVAPQAPVNEPRADAAASAGAALAARADLPAAAAASGEVPNPVGPPGGDLSAAAAAAGEASNPEGPPGGDFSAAVAATNDVPNPEGFPGGDLAAAVAATGNVSNSQGPVSGAEAAAGDITPNPQGAPVAKTPVETGGSAASTPPNANQYEVPQAIVEAVMSATFPSEMGDQGWRDRLQGRMRRALGRPDASPSFLAKWAEAKKDRSGKATWGLLKEWLQDPGVAMVMTTETRVREESSFKEGLFELVSRPELEMRFQCDRFPTRKSYVDKLISGAKGKPVPHPSFPKDKAWKQYKLLKSSVEGARTSAATVQSLSATAEIPSASAEGRQFAMAAADRFDELPDPVMTEATADDGDDNGSDDGDSRKRKRKTPKEKPPPTPDQLALAERKKTLKMYHSKLEKSLQSARLARSKMQEAAKAAPGSRASASADGSESMALATLSPLDEALLQNLNTILEEMQTMDNGVQLAMVSVADPVPDADDVAGLVFRAAADVRSATDRLKALSR